MARVKRSAQILDHRGLVFADPVGALARLELERVFVQAGDPTYAKDRTGEALREAGR